MKPVIRIFLLGAVLMIGFNTNGQVMPESLPDPYLQDIKVNYIRTWDAHAPEQDPNALIILPMQEVTTTTQYYDGLGRPLQTVVKQGSLITGQSPVDLVSPVVYDEYGRETYKYLPFAANNTGGNTSINDGQFKLNPFQQDQSFNQSQFADETFYYAKINYEASPLSRVLNTYAPGNNWVGASHGIETQYLINDSADDVRIWNIAAAPGSLPTSTAAYPAGELYKTVTVDEDGKQVVEYKDKEGHVILKKVQISATPGPSYEGWLSTYYVYDDLGNLRIVMQPKAIDAIETNWTFTAAIANDLCFRYEYDGRNRMIIKKVPGAGEVWMVYDARDRLIMTQDANMRAAATKKWLVTVYDELNRPVRTGLLTDTHDRAYHEALAKDVTNYPSTASGFELLTETYYDDYSWVVASGTSLSATLNTANTSNSDYFITGYNASPTYAQSITADYTIKGMVTGTKTKVLGTASQYLYTVSFYDDHGRVIQTQSINQTGGKDIATTQYDFSGKVLRTLVNHQKSGTNAQTHTVSTKMEYDHAGRLLKIWKNVDDASSDELITDNSYDALGQLTTKSIGDGLETMDYNYNIRGWLTGINKDYIAGSSTNYFAEELAYDKATSVAGSTSYSNLQYNGNIAGEIWKSKGDGIRRKYAFTYDNANRLSLALFVQNNSGTTWNATTMNFSMPYISYDANGNITKMNQFGVKLGYNGLIDQMVYSYRTNNNQLIRVSDAKNDPQTKLGDYHYSGTLPTYAYTYDVNGNLISDFAKGISDIDYNHLNLPSLITVTGKGTITYTYDAAGNKLQKTTVDNTILPSKTTTTTYIGGFVYQNDTLQFLGHEEGRIRWAQHHYTDGTTGYGFEYDYFLKDHLGNIRMVLTKQKDTAQYMATMETAYRTTETQLFSNIAESNYARASVSGYPADATTNPNDSLIRVNGSGQKIGPSLVLKVMGGDKFDVAVKAFYKDQSTGTTSNSIDDVLSALATGIVGITAGSKGSYSDFNTNPGPLYSAIQSFATANNPTISSKPRAYLNWILLDDQFNYVSSGSGAKSVGNYPANTLNTLAQSGIEVIKNGYLYIYVNNETQGWDVFFDNLSVKHYSGPITEETHYYPFGLTMAGISSKALKPGYAENHKQFNGIEHTTDLDLNQYDAFFRTLDPQIGKFLQIDPKIESAEAWSPYSAMLDNPIRYSDHLGDSTIKPAQKVGFVNLGPSGFDPNNKQYKNLVKHAVKRNQQRNAKGEPVVSITGVVTKGTLGVQGKLGNIGVSAVGSVNETDVVGVRENKLTMNGKNSEGKSSKRSGYGLNIAGFGREETQENSDNTLTTKISMPGVSRVSTKNIGNEKEVYSGTQNNLISFKAGLYYGLEINVSVNISDGMYVSPISSGGNASESTQIRMFIPDLTNLTPNNSNNNE